jgi:hypothetical protein
VPSDPFPIRSIRLLETTVIGNVFALRHTSVNGKSDIVQLVVGILVDNALSSLPEGLNRCIIPPLFQVAVLVELAALVVEAVRDFVTNHYTDPAVLKQTKQNKWIYLNR